MNITQQLSAIIADTAILDAVLKITGQQLTPQQKYIRSEKGKESKRKSNKKYADKTKLVDENVVRDYLKYWQIDALKAIQCQPVYHESLSELWRSYKKQENLTKTIKMQDFKMQLEAFNFPIVHSYISVYTGTRINRKVYELDVMLVIDKLNI